MRIFKNKAFNKWASKEGLDDKTLRAAVDEMERGLIDAELGGHVVKKRVAVGARGKSSWLRTLLAYRLDDKAFFVYGFAKNTRANISADELKALKHLAKTLLSYTNQILSKAVANGALIELDEVGDDG